MTAPTVAGTHNGRLDEAARDRRRIKNARNASRRGQERAPGSAKRIAGRLFRLGNRQQRGQGR